MAKKILHFFDKLEDRVRILLSHHPVLYGLIGGVAVVLFWKGVEETAGYFPILYGVGSLVVGTLILLITGLLVSFFVGDSIIISGFNHEKKLVEKTEEEVREEAHINERILEELEAIEQKLDGNEETIR